MRKKDDLLRRIVVDRRILAGKPVIKSTRVPVDEIIQRNAEGQAFEEVLEDYPNIKRDDTRASLEYAAGLVRAEDIIPEIRS
ncbi:MAG: DUF433 domain-containing protein [Nitrososphaerota archaeon]|nr:DUF433 domain-containing protein [Nitrososphaerota archaeon]MDG6924039.1 DUF433 domain-containing protein [Nitrososphaerota archaeon]